MAILNRVDNFKGILVTHYHTREDVPILHPQWGGVREQLSDPWGREGKELYGRVHLAGGEGDGDDVFDGEEGKDEVEDLVGKAVKVAHLQAVP